MFSRCVCLYGCFVGAGMVRRGGSINSYGIACSIAIPPQAVGGSYFIFFRGEWVFFSDCSMFELGKLWGSHPHLDGVRSILAGSQVVLFGRVRSILAGSKVVLFGRVRSIFGGKPGRSAGFVHFGGFSPTQFTVRRNPFTQTDIKMLQC
jgi:hypothetical protein